MYKIATTPPPTDPEKANWFKQLARSAWKGIKTAINPDEVQATTPMGNIVKGTAQGLNVGGRGLAAAYNLGAGIGNTYDVVQDPNKHLLSTKTVKDVGLPAVLSAMAAMQGARGARNLRTTVNNQAPLRALKELETAANLRVPGGNAAVEQALANAPTRTATTAGSQYYDLPAQGLPSNVAKRFEDSRATFGKIAPADLPKVQAVAKENQAFMDAVKRASQKQTSDSAKILANPVANTLGLSSLSNADPSKQTATFKSIWDSPAANLATVLGMPLAPTHPMYKWLIDRNHEKPFAATAAENSAAKRLPQ